MCYILSLNTLPSFGVSDINRLLQREGYSLSRIDSLPPESWKYVYIPLSFFLRDTYSGESNKRGSLALYLRKDREGLYLEIRYKYLQRKEWRRMSLRYYLERKESNLIPGTYRYYFLDPYSEEDFLCSKLDFYPESGEFVPRSILSSSGVLYSQQRKGHTERYFYDLSPLPSLRYRKKHYRGKETPFWRRYRELQEREEEKFIEFVLGRGYAKGVLPPGVERSVCKDYSRHSRGKSSTRREKVPQTA